MEMVLNNSFVELNNDEMMVVEGGGSVTLGISANTQQKVVTWGSATIAGAVTAAITAASGGVLAAVAPIIAAGVAGLIADVVGSHALTTTRYVTYSNWLIPGSYYLGTI